MINIQKLSHAVSISTDTLRIWERRYGFPTPKRDARGHRLYSSEQVEELRIIKKLQYLGYRPNKIFAISAADRRELLNKESNRKGPVNKTVLDLIVNLKPQEITLELRRSLRELGSKQFIHQKVVPLIYALDIGWSDGRVSIAREHLISDCIEELLKEILQIGERRAARKRLLFLTLSGERHKLGLLMSAVLFHVEGIECLLLNEEMPLSEVPQLAEELQVSGVALSFSSHYSSRQTKKDLIDLREILDQEIQLIAGGDSARQVIKMPNLHICTELEQIPELCKKQLQN